MVTCFGSDVTLYRLRNQGTSSVLKKSANCGLQGSSVDLASRALPIITATIGGILLSASKLSSVTGVGTTLM
jgi:hypothetical protein